MATPGQTALTAPHEDRPLAVGMPKSAAVAWQGNSRSQSLMSLVEDPTA